MTKRWPLHKSDFWERIPFFRLLLPLVAGILLYPLLSIQQGHVTAIIVALLLSSLAYIITAIVQQKNSLIKLTAFLAMHASMILVSWVLCYYHDARNHPQWLGNSISTADAYVARVVNTPVEKDKAWKLEVDVTHSVKDKELQPSSAHAIVYLYKYNAPVVREGDLIIVPNKWELINNSGNPFEFDYAAYMARNNIHYRQFVAGKNVVVHQYAEEEDLPWIRRLHHWCVQQLAWHITDKPTAGLLKAMLMNDTDVLDEELTQAYADTGIVHIIAISGGHITVFFFVVALLLGWIRNRKYHWVKYIAAIPLIWLYVVVAGAPPSAVRAATMFSLLGIGFALQKSPNGVNQLLATAFVVLCANPMWLYDIGFQLSFVAVLSIMLFYRPVYRWCTPVSKVARALWSAVAVSIAAEVLVAPLVVYYFHLFPLQFIVANVLAYIFMGVILLLGMVLIVVSPFYTIAQVVATITVALTTWFNSLVYKLQQWNFDAFHRLTLTHVQLVLLYLVIIFFAVALMLKKKPALFVGLTFSCCWMLSSCITQWQVLNQQMLVVYNAGKENYIELINGNKAIQLQMPDSINAQVDKYVLTPAHINMHVSTIEKAAPANQLLKIGDAKVFILNQPVSDTSIKVDYVVLNYAAKMKDIAAIKQAFQPRQVVIGNHIAKNSAQTIIGAAQQSGMEAHNVREQGAFTLKK